MLTEIQKESRRMLKSERAIKKGVGRLKKTIMYIDVGHLTYQQWVAYRKEYIGGSDIASIMEDANGDVLNPYQSKLECFHEKVGVISKIGDETEATFSGHQLEDIARENWWRFHDMDKPDGETLRANSLADKPVRYARTIKDKILYDPRWPHLKANIDGFIQNTRFEKAPRGLLEIKTGLGWVWGQYVDGIPVFYILQVQFYLMITGLKYAEIAVLLDGRFFKVFPMEANQVIQDEMLKQSLAFWTLVEEGRLIWEDQALSHTEKLQHLSMIEPKADSGEALDKYLKERFRTDYKVGKMIMTAETEDLGLKYLTATAAVNAENKIKTKLKSSLKQIFLTNQVDEMVDDKGAVLISNRLDEGAKSPTLRVSKKLLKLVDS